MAEDEPVRGLGAKDKSGHLTGILHYVLHPVTGHIAPACYMQDVFVDPPHRRKGIARELVLYLTEIGKREDWARLYWIAEGDNKAAQALYQNLGLKLNFTFHVMPLNMV